MASPSSADNQKSVNSVEAAAGGAKTSAVYLELPFELQYGPRLEMLRVIDLPFERQASQPEELLVVFSVLDGKDGKKYHSGWKDQIIEKLSLLPPLRENTVRLFDISERSDRVISTGLESTIATYVGELSPGLLHPFDILHLKDCQSIGQIDYNSMSSQWQESAQSNADPAERGPIHATIGNFKGNLKALQRSSLLCLNHDSDKLIVISCTRTQEVSLYSPRCDPNLRSKYLSDWTWTQSLAANDAFTAMGNRTRQNFVKLLMLDFFASHIYLLPSQIASMWLEGQIALGDFKHAPDADFLEQLSRHEKVLRDMHYLSEAIDFIIETLLSDLENTPDVPASRLLRERIEVLQKTCRQRLAGTMRSLESWDRRFEAQNKLRNIEESNSVKRLSILATIFLPLSLSASILSIQDRFRNLGPKLYDFIGVFAIVGSLALLVLILVRKGSRLWGAMGLSLRRLRHHKLGGIRLYPGLWLCLRFSYFAAWAILLASFVIRMFKSVGLGLKILGFGLAGTLGPLLLSIVGIRVWATWTTIWHA